MNAISAGALLFGLLGGLPAGMLGVGAEVVIVPLLGLLLVGAGLHPVFAGDLAVGSTLAAAVTIYALSGWNHHRRGLVHWLLVRQYLPGLLLGSLLGGPMIHTAAGWWVGPALGLGLLLAGVAVLVRVRLELVEGQDVLESWWLNSMFAVQLGIFGAWADFGGAILVLPAVIVISGLTPARAVGTTAVVAMFSALAGLTGWFQTGWSQHLLPPSGPEGYLLLPALWGLLAGALVGVPLGLTLTWRLSESALRFAIFLLLWAVGLPRIWI
ncbi:MAG: sulfite exporter TauE/SafE family protein [Magnetococcales bacterium]|nr:sulfite exporter TauE/SafE family protein [Magnetococcales bacterium]